eukprot:2795538-Prymnesium_polylepis.1
MRRRAANIATQLNHIATHSMWQVRRLAKWVKSHDPRSCGDVGVVDVGDGAAQEEAPADDKGTFHCAACNKWYKNAQQLSNHEKSTKHKQLVAKLRRQLKEDEDLKELEELAIDEGEDELEEPAEEARGGAKGGGAKGKKKKGRRDGLADGENAGDADGPPIELEAASMALPSPEDVALQTRQAFENSEDYKKMNKTQRRKALQQWEAEHEHIMEMLRKEGKEPKPEAAPKEKKPEQPAKKEKVHGSGAHSREIKTPKKKKAVYGKSRAAADDEEID